jgi:hypothetical protein
MAEIPGKVKSNGKPLKQRVPSRKTLEYPPDQKYPHTKGGVMEAHRMKKQREAIERNDRWAALTFVQQIAELDKTFGVGQGAQKQRAKIAAKMNIEELEKKNEETMKKITKKSN